MAAFASATWHKHRVFEWTVFSKWRIARAISLNECLGALIVMPEINMSRAQITAQVQQPSYQASWLKTSSSFNFIPENQPEYCEKDCKLILQPPPNPCCWKKLQTNFSALQIAYACIGCSLYKLPGHLLTEFGQVGQQLWLSQLSRLASYRSSCSWVHVWRVENHLVNWQRGFKIMHTLYNIVYMKKKLVGGWTNPSEWYESKWVHLSPGVK